eukprot:TRINITY_DN18838_c0_g2_i1.p1 TRINITY_DN18838_c0_g2~~TRINITY_DN18838_c0_g2_i1.p1  ORF type:complete len:198 (-),score=2.78 TRINITY_DN18838_c0_g2_i1:190-750(-)
MRKIYLQEVKLRKWLAEQEKLPIIDLDTTVRLPNKPQLCDSCQTEPFLSYTSCSCSQNVVRCLEHTFEGCECDPDKPSRSLYVRISRKQLDSIIGQLDKFVDGSIDPQGQIQIRKNRKRVPTNNRMETKLKSFQDSADTKIVLKKARSEELKQGQESINGMTVVSEGECKGVLADNNNHLGLLSQS